MNSYRLGQLVRIDGTFRDAGGALYDPPQVTAQAIDPADTQTVPSVTRDSVGRYHFTVLADVVGKWAWRLEGSGGQGVAEGEFSIRGTRF